MQCPTCDHDSRSPAKFCPECGARLLQACGQCGAVLPETGKFCSECGTAREGAAATISAPSESKSATGERRQLTVLFCDLVGSTELSACLDPEEMGEVVRAYYEMVAEVVRRFDGHVAKYLGDGVLVYFGYPQAHEDDPVRAITAALGMLVDLPVLNARVQERVPQMRDRPLAIRMGVHTGLVVVGDFGSGSSIEEGAIVGDTPNLAARLQGVAVPNTVVISDATRRLVTGVFVLEDLGRHELKGVAEPMQLFRAVRTSGMRSRLDLANAGTLTPLVGRQQQVGLLLDLWEHVQDGRGQVALISGDAGMGKSRLLQVLRERLAEHAHSWLECRCSPYHENSALYPIVELLEQGLLFAPEHSVVDKIGRLEAGLHYGGFSVPEALPLFTSLLSLPLPESVPPLLLSPEAQRRKTLEALVQWFLALGAAQPIVLVVEDLHWVDPSTVELLGMLLDQVPTAAAMVVFTFRPNFHPPWKPRTHVSQVTVPRLTRTQSIAMATSVAGKPLPKAVTEQIVAKTDGVPLFVEELTKMVLESGQLDDRGACFELRGSLPALAIPSTLQDSLMARLDRLGPSKEVAQLGATLGREFAYELLAALSPLGQESLDQALTELVQAELLYQRGSPPHATYTFKNTLIQEAAYYSLLRTKRQQYHRGVAKALQERFPETVATQPELLAYHYGEAGIAASAIEYWRRAGERETQRSANLEAINHFQRALQITLEMPDDIERAEHELQLQIGLGVPQTLVKGYSAPEVGVTYARARELCEKLGETPQMFPVLHGLWRFYLVRGDLRAAQQMAHSLSELAEAARDPDLQVPAGWAVGGTALWLGEFTPARTWSQQATSLYDFDRHSPSALTYGSDPGTTVLCYLAMALWFLGYPDQAVARIDEAVTLARRCAHPFSLAWATSMSAIIHQFRRDPEFAAESAERTVALSTEQGFPTWLGAGLVLHAWALAAGGDAAEALPLLEQGTSTLASAGQELAATYVLALASEIHTAAGHAAQVLALITGALALGEKNSERFYESELHRLQGEFLIADCGMRNAESGEENPQSEIRDPQSEAEACFRRAIEIARSQQAKSFELRAATSLAQLLRRQGRAAEARDLLAPIYAWFTEGFETRDLKEAKLLLAALPETSSG
jgi:predicted ATPase/class 3 adenylate cyclase